MLSNATIMGRNHRIRQQNCHDFSTATAVGACTFGLVLDGCGSNYQRHPARSEVGSALLGTFMSQWLQQHLTPTSLNGELLDQLHQDSLTFCRGLVQLIPFTEATAQTQFIYTHLLCTVVGFVTSPDAAYFFWAGDGYLCHNGQVNYLNTDNQPSYLAYHLWPTADIPKFQTAAIANWQPTDWLAVASDGWQPPQLTQAATPRTCLEMQRWLNQLARERGNFDDDGAIACYFGDNPQKEPQDES